ncbi:MAG: hypothetical protein GX366_08270 [Epulopiscium sp.]|nr:hypothetical protein [Candidatus Epulonipiscium sp.]
MQDVNIVLAEELERLASSYRDRADAKEVGIKEISYVLNKKMAQGKGSNIKILLKKFGALKLVEVREEDYPLFYKEAMKI